MDNINQLTEDAIVDRDAPYSDSEAEDILTENTLLPSEMEILKKLRVLQARIRISPDNKRDHTIERDSLDNLIDEYLSLEE